MLTVGVYAFPKFENGIVVYPSVIEVFSVFRGMMLVPTPENPFIFFLATVLLLTVAFVGMSAIFTKTLKWFSLGDVFKLTHVAIAWGVRNYFVSGIFLLGVVIWVGIGLTIYSESQSYFVALPVAILSLIIFLTVPLVTLNRQLLDSHQIKDWYKLSWPGWQPILISTTGLVLLGVLDDVVDNISIKLLPMEIAFQIIWWLLDTFVFWLLLSIFVYRIKWLEVAHELRIRTNIRFYAAWLLMYVRFFFIALWVAPTLLLAMLVNLYVIPPYVDILKITGAKLGMLAGTFIYLSNGFVNLWPVLGLPLIVLILLIYGRYLLLYDHLSLNTTLNSSESKDTRQLT